MSTKYFRIKAGKEGKRIGLRSGAGLYCFDCKQTLCVGGVEEIHGARYETKWMKSCPKCKSTPSSNLKVASSVRTCCSFTWAMTPPKFRGDGNVVVDEYGQEFTAKEFVQIIKECPIQFC